MHIRRRTARLIGVATSAVLVTFGLAAAPQAAFASTPCPDGEICLYKDAHGQGLVSIQQRFLTSPWSIDDFRNTHYSDGSTINDSVSSIINNTATCFYVYPDIHFNQGSLRGGFLIIPHSGIEAGRLFPNDAISSAFVQAQPCHSIS